MVCAASRRSATGGRRMAGDPMLWRSSSCSARRGSESALAVVSASTGCGSLRIFDVGIRVRHRTGPARMNLVRRRGRPPGRQRRKQPVFTAGAPQRGHSLKGLCVREVGDVTIAERREPKISPNRNGGVTTRYETPPGLRRSTPGKSAPSKPRRALFEPEREAHPAGERIPVLVEDETCAGPI